MKETFFIFLFLLFSMLGSPASEVLSDTRPMTQLELKNARENLASEEKKLPIEKWRISYITLDDGKLAPAFTSLAIGTAYLWDGVILDYKQIPKLVGAPGYQYGSGAIIPVNPKEVEIKLLNIAPPINFLSVTNDSFAVGCYDNTFGIYYRFGTLEYTLDQLPEGAQEKGLILDAKVTPVTVSVIPPPAGYGSASTPPTPPTSSPSAATATPSVSLPKTQASPSPTVQTAPVKAEQSSPPWTWGIVGLLLLAVFCGVWWKFLRK
jgi:hypothetical protein